MGATLGSKPIVVSVPRGDLDPALRFAAAEAGLHRCPVRLVHAYEPGPSLSGPPVTESGAAQVLHDAVRRAQELVEPGLPVSGQLVRGPSVESVLDSSADARLVILQRRDLLHLIRSLNRSLDGAAVRRSQIPLVCVPPDWTATARDGRPVTVGVDAPEHSGDLVRAGAALAHERGAPLRLLHTWSFPQPYDEAVLRRVGREWEASVRADIERVLRPLRSALAVEVEIEVLHGRPRPALLAATTQSRLVVLGRHASRRAIGSRLGPVTRAVLHVAPCPVVLLPTTALPTDTAVAGPAHGLRA